MGRKIPFPNRERIQMWPMGIARSNMKVVTGSPMQFEAQNGAVVLKSLVFSAHVPSESTL